MMCEILLTPKVLRNEQNIQLSYETPHRIYDATLYPLPSPNGSAIIIYGHENGVRIIWRGGRPFKPPSASSSDNKSKTNGTSTDAVMIIDSDDEQPGSHPLPFEDNPEFEDEDEDIDYSKSYPSMIQHLDLNFGTAALHLAVPPVSTAIMDASFALGPGILKDQLVFSAACSDHKIRLITLPLIPPSPARKSQQDIWPPITAANAGYGKWGETMLELTASTLPSDGVSMTFTTTKAENASATRARSSQTKTPSNSSSRLSGEEWHILVASHSREGPGQLLVHRIPIISRQTDGKVLYSPSLSKDHEAPFQQTYLSSPATSIVFNPDISSTPQSSRLLLADKTGACRIYDCLSPHISASVSVENTNSTASVTQQGSWLLTLYPGFQTNKSDTMPSGTSVGNYGRKAVVHAQWVMGGKAVIVLLADGEWGIWDVEGAGPGGNSKGILGRQSLKGGAITTFSISGWIDSTPIKSSYNQGSVAEKSASRFAPMTPSTRKTAEPVLFNGRSSHLFPRGQISVTRLPSTSTTSLVDECVAFWLEDSYVIIPNIRVYWEAQTRRSGGGSGNLFAGSSLTTRMIRLEGVNLRGETCCGIDLHARKTSSKTLLPAEMLIMGEHRYVILIDGTPVIRGPRRHGHSQTEYQIMAPMELDVVEIDQVLSRMENGNSLAHTRRGVVFP